MKPTKYSVVTRERFGAEVPLLMPHKPIGPVPALGAEVYRASEVEPALRELEIARSRLANLELMEVIEVDADGFTSSPSELGELVESRGPGKWRVSILIESEP